MGEEDLSGGQPSVSHAPVALQHPDHDIREAVLGLARKGLMDFRQRSSFARGILPVS